MTSAVTRKQTCRCGLCKRLGRPEAVTALIRHPDGRAFGRKEQFANLAHVIDADEPPSNVDRWLKQHLARLDDQAPTALVRAPREGSPDWQRVTERAIAVGDIALNQIEGELADYVPRDRLAAANLGLKAAAKRGDWAAKGRQLDQMQALVDLASGFDGPDLDDLPDGEVIEGESVEVPT